MADGTTAPLHSDPYLRCWAQFCLHAAALRCCWIQAQRSVNHSVSKKILFLSSSSFFFFCFLPLACRHLSLVPAIQSILPTVCSTNQTCVHPVLIQGLRSGHCCLAPLVLLSLGIEEADGTALVTVKPSWPSLHTEFCLQTSTIECLFWVSTVGCFWGNNSTGRVNLQDECH